MDLNQLIRLTGLYDIQYDTAGLYLVRLALSIQIVTMKRHV